MAGVATFSSWYLPIAHGVHAVVAELNSVPGVQDLQVTDATLFSSWYLPVVQDKQPNMYVGVTNLFPASQCLQVASAGAALS